MLYPILYASLLSSLRLAKPPPRRPDRRSAAASATRAAAPALASTRPPCDQTWPPTEPASRRETRRTTVLLETREIRGPTRLGERARRRRDAAARSELRSRVRQARARLPRRARAALVGDDGHAARDSGRADRLRTAIAAAALRSQGERTTGLRRRARASVLVGRAPAGRAAPTRRAPQAPFAGARTTRPPAAMRTCGGRDFW